MWLGSNIYKIILRWKSSSSIFTFRYLIFKTLDNIAWFFGEKRFVKFDVTYELEQICIL